jgi:hypothetical protein
MMPPRQPLTVVKLSDHFGQYVLTLTCGACGHSRTVQPQTLARMAGVRCLPTWSSECVVPNVASDGARRACDRKLSGTVERVQGRRSAPYARRCYGMNTDQIQIQQCARRRESIVICGLRAAG